MSETKRVVRNGDIEIAVYEQGNPDGDTIVLVHGWPDTHHLWDGVTPYLVDRFRVVSYDTRGHGATTNPAGYRDFSLVELARDFFAVIDAVSPDRPVHVLAHDWGSVQVWEAVCEPGAHARVASFTSVSGPNLDHTGRWIRNRIAHPTPRNVLEPLSQLASSGYAFFFMIPWLPKLAFALAANERRWRGFIAAAEGTEPAQIHLGPTLTKDMVNGLRIYRANLVARALADPRERRTNVAVQLIVNHRDLFVRPAIYDDEARWTRRLWRRDINAGHWVPYSRPKMLAEATIQLIDALTEVGVARELRRSEVGKPAGRPFEDQLLVITGAGSGIGRETALAFARVGADVVLSDIDRAAAEQTAVLIAQLGGIAHAYQLDVTDEAAMAAHAQEVVQAHGVPDILVNNAGIGQAGRFLDTPADSFRKVVEVNLFGVVNGVRAFAPRMVERGLGGHIVNVSSMAAYLPQQSFSAYSTSKSAVFMFSDCLRAELASAGIGVSTICPGIVHTNIVASTEFSGVASQSEKQQAYDRLYRKRGYTPDRVATQIVEAVRANKAIVPVTPEAHVGYHYSRLAPGLVRFAAKMGDLTRLR